MNKSGKRVQNLLTSRIPMIKLAVRELRSVRFYAVLLVSLLLAAFLNLSPAIPSFMNDVTALPMDIGPPCNDTVRINCTGGIVAAQTPTTAPIAYKSEIRGVYCSSAILMQPHDWDVIAETLAGYGINMVVVDSFNTMGWAAMARCRDEMSMVVDAFHARGIKVIAITAFPYVTAEHVWGEPSGQEHLMAWDHTLTPVTAACPIRIRDHIKSLAEELATFDIDGVMFDYVRYSNCYQWVNGQKGDTVYATDMCYCPLCKATFEEWLGEGTITDWPGDFAPEGLRYNEFMEWRTQPLTELVRDAREWMRSINPDLEFSAAVWAATLPTGRRYYLGQDTANWVGKGYLDFVAPMLYVMPEDLPDLIQEAQTYFTGGPEGKIPMPIWITNGISSPTDLDTFKEVIEQCRQYADGWIIWRYGGPGEDWPWIDITPYLDKIKNETVGGLSKTFTLSHIKANKVSDTSMTITWTTDLPVTSKVEYSTSPLFNASYMYWSSTNFHYWDVDYTLGTIVENDTHVIYHNVTLTALMPETKYYFRIQSQDASGIATSKVLTFTTES